MRIKSIYYKYNPFTKEWNHEPCTIIEEKGEKSCVIEYQIFFKDSKPILKRSTVRKSSVKYYQEKEESEKLQNAGWKKYNYFD